VRGSSPSSIDDPDSFHQLEKAFDFGLRDELEQAFRNGTIKEDDSLSKIALGISSKKMIKPTYQEKYEGLLTEFSWLDSYPKVVSPVKNQGKECAASYAFAVVAALESAQALENVAGPKSLSE